MPIGKLLVPEGVRQGSVEGPLQYVAVCDALASALPSSRSVSEFPEVYVAFDPELKKIRHRHNLMGDEGEERMVVSPI
eukprot:853467-Pyramimonas_sp.AAC.1